MKQKAFLLRFWAIVLILLLPSPAAAQFSLKSSAFELTDINFANIFTVIPEETVIIDIVAEGPTVTTLEPTRVVIEWTTLKAANGKVQYGSTTSYGQEVGNSAFTTKHSITLLGLTPETTYQYRVVSTDRSGAEGASGNKSFTTPPELGINSISVSNVTYDSAVVSWTTAALTRSSVEYGTTTAYGTSVTSGSANFTTKHTTVLSGLQSGTEYHIRIRAENENGISSTSSDLTFTTTAEPVFTSVTVSAQSANEMTIRWITNTPTNGIIRYQRDGTTDELTAGDSEYKTDHSTVLRGLVGGSKKYNYEITASDQGGKQVKSGRRDFTTPVDQEAPKIEKLQVTTALAGDKIIFTAKWITNEPAKGKVKVTNNAESADTREVVGADVLSASHIVVGTDLKPSRPYTLEAQAVDDSGNVGKAEIRFVTPKETKNVFKLIAEKFGAQFGWLLKLFQK